MPFNSCLQLSTNTRLNKTLPYVSPTNLRPFACPPPFACRALPACLQDVRVKGVPDSLRNQLQKRGVGRLALDLVAPKQEGLDRVFQMMLG
jgi:hypothetical protein